MCRSGCCGGRCGACCGGCFLGALISAVLTLVVVSAVFTAALSYPVFQWVSAHKVALGEVGTCLNATFSRVNETLAKELSEKCQELFEGDKCDGDNLDDETKEKCEECLCETDYYLQKMQPPLEPELLHCCKPLSTDKGTEFLVEGCEDLVTNLTKESEKYLEKCEKKNVIVIMAAQPLLLQAFPGFARRNLPKFLSSLPTSSAQISNFLALAPYFQGFAASVLLTVGFALLAIVTKCLVPGARAARGSDRNGALEEHLL
eukprot:Skav201042  [mRNA]  locus=scaffold3386:286047:286826:- [translate_table: standard]